MPDTTLSRDRRGLWGAAASDWVSSAADYAGGETGIAGKPLSTKNVFLSGLSTAAELRV